MSPPTEQLIRDYLNRLSVAARSRLDAADRRVLLERARALIELQAGPAATASPAHVQRVVDWLGDPAALVDLEYQRIATERARPAGRDGPSRRQPRPRALTGGQAAHGVPARDGAARRQAAATRENRSGSPPAGARADVSPPPSASLAPGDQRSGGTARPPAANAAGRAGEQDVPGDPGRPAGESPAAAEPPAAEDGVRAADARNRDGEMPDDRAPARRADRIAVADQAATGARPAGTSPGAAATGPLANLGAGDPVTPAGRPGTLSADPAGARAEAHQRAPGRAAWWSAGRARSIAGRLPRRQPGSRDGASSGVAGRGAAVAGPASAAAGRLAASALGLARASPLEAAALVVTGLGTAVFPPVWLVGAALALMSKQWDFRDKWTGFALPVVLVVLGTTAALILGGARPGVAGYAAEAWLAAGRLSRVAGLLGAGYLTWRLRRGRRRPKVPPWLGPRERPRGPSA